jgi:hypothetical protein
MTVSTPGVELERLTLNDANLAVDENSKYVTLRRFEEAPSLIEVLQHPMTRVNLLTNIFAYERKYLTFTRLNFYRKLIKNFLKFAFSEKFKREHVPIPRQTS